MWLFANGLKHRQNIYRWKEFFITCMNSRSLPQNKALFCSYQLAMSLFARKCVQTILSLSLENGSTILKRELRWVGWDQEPFAKTGWRIMFGRREFVGKLPCTPSTPPSYLGSHQVSCWGFATIWIVSASACNPRKLWRQWSAKSVRRRRERWVTKGKSKKEEDERKKKKKER